MALPVVATRIPGCVDAVVDGQTEASCLHAMHGPWRRRFTDTSKTPRCDEGMVWRAGTRVQDFRQEVMWEALYQEYVRLLRKKGFLIPEASLEGLESADTVDSGRPTSTIGDSLEETRLTQEDLAQS